MIEVEEWGLIDYQEALQKQKEYVQRVIDGGEEYLILCSHPSVVTLGRASLKSDLQGWTGDVYEVERGGKATYHGPEQVICYPIIDLNKRGRDLHKYLRTLENILIETLEHYGIKAEGGRPDATGVWVGEKKIASIGVAAKKWVTYHGLAININKDPQAFQGISPCGFSTSVMTSLEELRGERMSKSEFEVLLAEVAEDHLFA